VTLWRGLDAVVRDVGSTPRRRSVITIGVFDGVHRGHQVIVSEAVRRAHALKVPAVAVTFDPHPMSVLRPDRAPLLLTTIDRRAELLGDVGIDHVVVLPFDAALSHLSPRAFIESTVVGGLNASEVVVGIDFRFGHQAAGDVASLRELGDELGFAVEGVGLVGDGRERWSSTGVRQRLADGDVRAAAAILGRPHRVDGRVVRGDARGRGLGYPTANVALPIGMAVPADGVYAGRMSLLGDDGRTGRTLGAAVSVGTNPTFGGVERRVEAHCLDVDDLDVYGRPVGVEFIERIRPMIAFDTADDLVARMAEDVLMARRALTAD
jgi:riboflavin kinase/FMN adenylyltransferase